MHKTAAQSLALGVMTLFLCANAWAQYGGKRAFDASFTVQGQTGTSTMRLMSDGKGHERQEFSSSAAGMVSLYDWNNKIIYNIMNNQKLVTKMPLTSEVKPPITDEKTAQAQHARALGLKVIDGHPCHGWQTDTQGYTSECWVADDLGIAVQSSTKGPNTSSLVKLTKYSATAPVASLFEVPAGYKVMEIPVGGHAPMYRD